MIPFLALLFWLALLWFLRHEVGSLEFKVYLSLIFWSFRHFFSRRVPPICPRHRAEFGIRWRCSEMRSSVPPKMSAHKTATAVAVLCAAISGGTLHLTVEHL